MPRPQMKLGGAYSVAYTLLGLRGLQIIAIIPIIGILGWFISTIVETDNKPPDAVPYTISIVSLFAIYCLISIPFWLDQRGYPKFAAIDAVFLLLFIVAAVLLGKPASYLRCSALVNSDDTLTNNDMAQAVIKNLGKDGTKFSLYQLCVQTQLNCYLIKAVWGLSIAIAVLLLATTAFWAYMRVWSLELLYDQYYDGDKEIID